jgi:hypothetical protein
MLLFTFCLITFRLFLTFSVIKNNKINVQSIYITNKYYYDTFYNFTYESILTFFIILMLNNINYYSVILVLIFLLQIKF